MVNCGLEKWPSMSTRQILAIFSYLCEFHEADGKVHSMNE
jgi:hypothetical protein